MLKELERFIESKQLLRVDDRVLLAVSGGMDSMVLLHLFKQLDVSFSVAHANFQLRGTESDGDEQFVRDTCARLNIPFFSKRFDTNNHATERHLSIQMAARELRYQWFQELASSEGFQCVATAHHLSDSAETMLLNLLHGKGLPGLTGIPVRNGNVIRPLLFATRQQLVAFATENEIVWREDISNATDDYERNFLRHQVVPSLKELNPSLEDTLARTAFRSQQTLSVLHQALDNWKKVHVQERSLGWSIAKSALKDCSSPVLYLSHVLEPIGFHFDQCVSVVEALDAQSGKQFFSSSHRVVVDRDELLVSTISISDDTTVLILSPDAPVVRAGKTITASVSDNTSIATDPSWASFDMDKISFPLTWRMWQPGDRFHPLGMKGSKKVSDYLVDEKISRVAKDQVAVLESAGEIIWVVGYRIDERFRVQPSTQRMLVLRVDDQK